MRFLPPSSSRCLEKYSWRCASTAPCTQRHPLLSSPPRPAKKETSFSRSWLERSRSRGLRGNFKLISTSDLCLPRKQRTFETLLSLSLSRVGSLFFNLFSLVFFFPSFGALIVFHRFPFAFSRAKKKLSSCFIFDARPFPGLTGH